MAVTANSIITPQTPKAATAQCSAANSNYSAPTGTALLVTAGPNGARLTKLRAIPTVSISTATQLQEFRSTDGGTTKRFTNSALMAVYTLNQTTAAPVVDFGYSDDYPKILVANEQVHVAVGQNFAINFEAEWADY